MPMLLHYSSIATKGYGCNRVRSQFALDDAKRAAEDNSPQSTSAIARANSSGSFNTLMGFSR
jgi:hypothetical protein